MTGGPSTSSAGCAAPAVLQAWYPGEQGGPALADVLLGRRDATGRLPVTFPRRLADAPTARIGRYPEQTPRFRYGEGRRIGFRWYDDLGIRARYPFGFGRSYTRFAFDALAVRGRQISFSITNVGHRAGVAVPQVYVRLPRRAAPLRLAAFARVSVRAGRRVRATVVVPRRGLEIWTGRTWRRPGGRVAVTVRTDARTVELRGTL